MAHRHRDTLSYTTFTETQERRVETHTLPLRPTLREQPRASYEPGAVGTCFDGCIAYASGVTDGPGPGVFLTTPGL